MTNHSLKIVKLSKEEELSTSSQVSVHQMQKKEAMAKYERLWLQNPEKFNPMQDAMHEEILNREWKMIKNVHISKEMKAVDLGCGYGLLTLRMQDAGARHVDAVDVASNALKRLEKHNCERIRLIQDYVPYTQLEDNGYDLVVCTNLIALLPSSEYRLFFSELSRLVKSDGKVIFSTPLDMYSLDALEKFLTLAETEFILESWSLSYDYLYLKILNFLETPETYLKASHDKNLREQKLKEKKGFGKLLFKWNTTVFLAWFWKIIHLLFYPILKLHKHSRKILKGLEKISRFFWDKSRATHVIVKGKRRPLFTTPSPDQMPQERKPKRTVWE